MSVVVAFKYKDGVIVGSDRRVTLSYHTYEDDIATKIHVTTYSNHVIGTVGALRAANVISTIDELMPYKDILDNVCISDKYLISVIVPKMMEVLENAHQIDATSYMTNNNFMYVTNNKIFTIGSDFAVIEEPCWAAIGCGEELVSGLLSIYDDEDFKNMDGNEAIDLLNACITQACGRDNAVGNEYDFVMLKDDGFLTNMSMHTGDNIASRVIERDSDEIEEVQNDKKRKKRKGIFRKN